MKCKHYQVNQIHPDLCVPLTQYRLIEIKGTDAEKYLQGQLTCNVAKLEVGSHTLTCHCDPKGKISGLFRLYRTTPEQFFAIVHQSLLPEALIQLKKYAVFSKVSFTEVDTLIYGVTSGDILAKLHENSTALLISSGQKRAIVWGEMLETNGSSELWDLIDIQDGLPILLKENQFEFIPQATNLQAVENAISFTKGCYIGQETVARAKYRGANKRAMFTLVGHLENEIELPTPASSVEMQLGENWRATGTILASVAYQNKLWLQIVMNKEVEPETRFRFNGVELQIYDLPYSLDE